MRCEYDSSTARKGTLLLEKSTLAMSTNVQQIRSAKFTAVAVEKFPYLIIGEILTFAWGNPQQTSGITRNVIGFVTGNTGTP